MNKYTHIWIFLAVVWTFVLWAFISMFGNYTKRGKNVVSEVIIHDTVTFTSYDTIRIVKTEYRERRIIDTIYVKEGYIDIEQMLFADSGNYDIWISGYRPSLDSVRIYRPTIERTIYKTEIREVQDKSWAFIPYIGVDYCDGFRPDIGVMVTTPCNLSYGVSVGLDREKRLNAGIRLGYNFKR